MRWWAADGPTAMQSRSMRGLSGMGEGGVRAAGAQRYRHRRPSYRLPRLLRPLRDGRWGVAGEWGGEGDGTGGGVTVQRAVTVQAGELSSRQLSQCKQATTAPSASSGR